MYIVIEIQKNSGEISTLTNTYETLEAAEQKFHQILSYAAVTTLEKHTATILNENGFSIRHEAYPRVSE